MRKTKIKWLPQATEQLREIRRFISRNDPKTARDYVKRLRDYVKKRLELFPESGSVVEEFMDAGIREIYFGNYRIIYSHEGEFVEIALVYHGARRMGSQDFS